jgi:predicted enzyme related to lactoylglutathione lyase
MDKLQVRSNITFLYYNDLEAAAHFYSKVMKFKLVVDQGWAKVYAMQGNAFIGIVSGDRGFHQAQDDNAVLITLVVDDVKAWHDYLKEQNVAELGEYKEVPDIQIQGFFFKDPGGYAIEIQKFLEPETARTFFQTVP